MRSTNSATSSSLNALPSDSIGTACRTFAKPREGAAPTFCVGNSGVTQIGKARLDGLERRRSASYSASETVGASS